MRHERLVEEEEVLRLRLSALLWLMYGVCLTYTVVAWWTTWPVGGGQSLILAVSVIGLLVLNGREGLRHAMRVVKMVSLTTMFAVGVVLIKEESLLGYVLTTVATLWMITLLMLRLFPKEDVRWLTLMGAVPALSLIGATATGGAVESALYITFMVSGLLFFQIVLRLEHMTNQ